MGIYGNISLMSIAVSLFRKDEKYYTNLLYGEYTELIKSENGLIALINEDSLVLYETVIRKTNVYLFRGLGDIEIPFVRPNVNLVSHGNNILQKRKLVKTLEWMKINGHHPDAFNDNFWMKVQSIINSKSYGKKQLLSIIESHKN